MREDYHEKTEPPTKKRLKETREKGHVYKSHDTTVSGMLLFNMIILFFFSKYMYLELYFISKGLLNHLDYSFDNPDIVIYWFQQGTFALLLVLAPLLIGTIMAALVVNLFQVGFVFSFTPLKPRWSNINIFDVQNYKKYFDFKVILKIVLGQLRIIAVTISSIWLIGGDIFTIYQLTTANTYKILLYLFIKAMQIGFFLAISYLLIGLIELAYHRYRYYKELRMTPQEIREEIRRSEGNLEVKGQIYSFMKKFMNRPANMNLAQAAVIFTSPTHGISIALMFYPETMEAPLCIAKGIMSRSKDILNQAQLHSIPVIENIPLSKRLFGLVKIGQFVPSQMFHEVAAALAKVNPKKITSMKDQKNVELVTHA